MAGIHRVMRYGTPATFVAVSAGNTWAHSAADVDELAATLAGAPPDLEFFDVDGVPQIPEYDDEGRLAKLEPTGTADPDAVLRRIEAVVAHVVAFLEEAGEPLTGIPRIPSATGLPARARDVHFTGRGPHDPRGFFHNALHRAGVDHD
jgi:hypothetical protein